MADSLFGTDGIRSKVGTDLFTSQHLLQLGRAIGQWAQETYTDNPYILLGHDTRQSASLVKTSLKAGMYHYPITLIDAGILPTPAVSQLMKHNPTYHCGVIISASHNPYYDNGIKIIDARTGKIDQQAEERISALYHERLDTHYEHLGTEITEPLLATHYVQKVVSFFKQPFLQDTTIVLDCAHGATYKVAPVIFKQLGARVITLNANPNGTNINASCGALFPEELAKNVLLHKADLGFAFDGDGDRVIAINRHGEIKNGDDIIALLSTNPRYAQTKTVVGTVMSNYGLELFLHKRGIQLERTAVGDKHVTEKLLALDELLGGEQSGHIIVRDYLATGDGIFTALSVAETMLLTENLNLDTFIPSPQFLVNIPVSHKKDLTSGPLAHTIAHHTSLLKNGRSFVRYSGTENILRVMIEDEDLQTAKIVSTQLAQQLQQYFTE